MIKKVLRLFMPCCLFCFLPNLILAQCVIEPWSLQKRIDLSSNVIEGKVIDQHPFKEVGKNLIYTASIIEVYKVFKGKIAQPEYIEIITFGGQIGLEKHHADPELELDINDIGVFMLAENKVSLPDFMKANQRDHFQGTASVQSFIKYDLSEDKAYDISEFYSGIATSFYETIQLLTKSKFTPIKSVQLKTTSKRLYKASPVISSFTAKGNAGTGDVLTIKGTGFGSAKGNGRVEFLDANFGDGRRIKSPFAADYSQWNDTQIKVRIPSRAGTGTIKIATNDSSFVISSSNFLINFSHLNATYQPSGFAEQYYPTDHRNDNGKGGYTFKFNTRFKANSGMVNSFLRAIETWRCGTLMNWDIGKDTTLNVINGDQTNIVRITKFTDSRLAVCYSFWQGCTISGSNMEWFVSELDIEADSSRKWYYGTGNPASNEFDFQSVIAHELGHGHQLGHVISGNEMMHFSIANGQKKSTLSSNDLLGGLYVKDKSIKNNACSGSPLTALTASNCGYTKAMAGFKTNKTLICPSTSVILADTSLGIVKSYLWNFGENANPSTATGKGPHNVSYSSEGLKTVKLYATNDFGTDSSVKLDYIHVLPLKPAAPKNLVFSDTACLAATNLSVDSFGELSTINWSLPLEATVLSSTKNTIRVSWTSAGGPYPIKVKLINQCGSSDSLTGKVLVLNNPTSSFTASENGRTVTFTNTSQFAINYKWYFGDGDSSSEVNPVHIYPVGKAYSATLKASNKCKVIPFTKTVNPFHPSDIKLIENEPLFAFPNPTQNIVYLSKSVSCYSLVDITGHIITAGNDKTITLSTFSNGIYFLNVTLEDGRLIPIKIIKN